jgi:nucleoside 2-deoxyribosyltransferase
MAKRFFLSTRKDRASEANAISAALEIHGWARTFTWSAVDGADINQQAAMAIADLQGVRDADVLIVLLPGGYGTHVEIGAALALKKPVILHSPDCQTLETPYTCVFHYHPDVTLLVSPTPEIDSILAHLNQL